MDEFETPNPDYLKGFNEGYTMEAHNPSLAEKLSQVKSTSERTVGFKDGRKQHSLDRISELRPDRFKRDREPSPSSDASPAKSKGRGLER